MPERLEAEEQRLDFFDLVERLVLQGAFQDAWSILKLHSALAADESNPDYKSLQNLFLSHPLMSGDHDGDDHATAAATSVEIWHISVQRTKSIQRTITDEKILHILSLLLGDLRADQFQSWEEFALALLLFTQTPPFSQSLIIRIFERAMREFEAGDPAQTLRCRIVRDILRGEPGPPIRVLCEQYSVLLDRKHGGCSMVALLSTAHLAQLMHLSLSCQSGGEEGLEGGVLWPQNEVGITEELFLQAVELLALRDAPLEVLVGYCMACPLRGLSYAQTLLMRRAVCCDEDVWRVYGLLCQLDLYASARVVLSTRGTWWLRQRRNRCKALHFYCAASDASRAAALLEDSVWELLHTVGDASQEGVGIFKELKVVCERQKLSVSRSQVGSANGATSRVLTTLHDVQSLLAAYDSSRHSVVFEKDTFDEYAESMVGVCRLYANVISHCLGTTLLSDESVHALQALASSVAQQRVPLRFCLHFLELISLVDQALEAGRADHRWSVLDKGTSEQLLLILFLTTTSQHAEAYKAGSSELVIQQLSSRLIDVFSRSLMQDNRDHKLHNPAQELGTVGASQNRSSLIDYIIAS
jgi:hypothetical protein